MKKVFLELYENIDLTMFLGTMALILWFIGYMIYQTTIHEQSENSMKYIHIHSEKTNNNFNPL